MSFSVVRTARVARWRILAAAGLSLVLAGQSSHGMPAAPLAGMDRALTKLLAQKAPKIGAIIQFADAPTDADARALRDAGFLPGMIRYQIVPAVYAQGPAAAVLKIARNPRVRYIEHDAEHQFTLDRATVAGRARQVWDAKYKLSGQFKSGGFDGAGVGIAIVDSGVDATHPDLRWKPLAVGGLKAKTVANYKMLGRDSLELISDSGLSSFVEANTLAVDVPNSDNTGGHGTHVAGIAAGTGEASGGKYAGAAPGANLIGFGAGETLLIHLGLAAFDYIHRHHKDLGIRVVSNSWGGPGDWNPASVVTKAAQRLVNKDKLVVVFAAGNNGGDGSSIRTSVWANIPEVISVANYYDRQGWLDDSSSRGRADLERTWPDVAASGTQVISTAATAGPVTYFGSGQDAVLNHLLEYGEPDVVPVAPVPATVEQNVAGQDVVVGPYASFTGTSMATPFIAGVIALMLEANPLLKPYEVKEILRETANMPPGRSYTADGYAIGKGVVDAAEAVAAALRRREGAPLGHALRTAYVNSSGTPYKLNYALPRRISLASPTPGQAASGSVSVNGTYYPGPVSSDAIPLYPTGGAAAASGAPVLPAAPVGAPAILPQATFFADGFETDTSGWTMTNDGVGPGLLTQWSLIDENAFLTWAGTHGGARAFYAGHWPGTPFNSGVYYEDLANTSLVSPPIDLTQSTSASLSYWRAGQSEGNFDWLRVYAAPDGSSSWTKVSETSGTFLDGNGGSWEEATGDLTSFVGQTIRLRFEFTSDEYTLGFNLSGWYIDDVSVTGTSGSPTTIIVPSLSATPATGVGSLTTNLTYSAASNAAIDSYTVDFGDGSPVHTAAAAGNVTHTYGAGQWTATLTVTSGTTSQSRSVLVDVAPTNMIQIRIAGGLWQTVAATNGVAVNWSKTLSLAGIPAGPALIEVRQFGSDKRMIKNSVTINVA